MDQRKDAILFSHMVSGGARFIGHHLSGALAAAGDDVVVFDASSAGILRNIEKLLAKIDRQDEWPCDFRRIAADLSPAQGKLGYRSNVDIADGLARTVASFRSA